MHGAPKPRLAAVVAIAAMFAAACSSAASPQGMRGPEALTAIVGVWQSDTTNGTSAISNCVWTPERGAVLCEQRLTTPDGEHRALDLFTFDPAGSRYALYVISRPGEAASPVALSIDGSTWVYGGKEPNPDGTYYRTVNDFSKPGSYTWRQESSRDGKMWSAGAHGNSKRLR